MKDTEKKAERPRHLLGMVGRSTALRVKSVLELRKAVEKAGHPLSGILLDNRVIVLEP